MLTRFLPVLLLAKVVLTGGQIVSVTGALKPTLVSTASVQCSGTLAFDGIRFINTGNLTTAASATLILQDGAKIVNRATAFLGAASIIKDTGWASTNQLSQLINDYGGSLKLKDSTTIRISVAFNNSGTVSVPVSTNLLLTAGSTSPGTTMNINGTLTLQGGSRGAFIVQSGARFALAGNLTLQNSTLYLPVRLGVNSIPGLVTMKKNATLVWGEGESSSASATPFLSLWLQDGATFKPATSTARIAALRMETGSVVDVDGGRVSVEKTLIWNGGTFTGQGSVQLNKNSTLSTTGTKYLSVSPFNH